MLNTSYEAKKYDHLFGTPGFSDKLLKNHFKLYEGYVKNVNEIINLFSMVKDPEKLKETEFAETRRRFGWEFNGMRLHEYYFGNIGKTKTALSGESPLRREIVRQFVSFENWKNEFTVIGTMRGIGWVILALDSLSGRLFNVWINEHDMGYLAGSKPLLVMDVFEHAFMTDYALEKDKYISAFWNAIQWDKVEIQFGGEGRRDAGKKASSTCLPGRHTGL